MKLIRFILSNLILITFFCAIIYTYYYWDNLTGEDTPAGQAVAYLSKEFKSVEAFIDGIKVKQSDTQEKSSTAEKAVASVVEVDAGSGSGSVVGAEQTEIASAESIESRNTVSAVKEGVFVTPEIEQSLNQAVSDSINKKSDTSALSIESTEPKDPNRVLWVDARKAFYKRNYEASITAYKQLIENTVDNYDAYGELGNVYFNQGKKTEAAAAYYEAASLLVKFGYERRADSLLPLLTYLDAEKATQLKELLNSERS